MNPGKMDRRLTVQVRALTKDGAGGRVQTWTDSYKVWGEIVKHKGNEGMMADADRRTDEVQFRIRYRRDIASDTHRILYQLKFYDITGIEEEGRQDRLLLTCRAVQSLSHA